METHFSGDVAAIARIAVVIRELDNRNTAQAIEEAMLEYRNFKLKQALQAERICWQL